MLFNMADLSTLALLAGIVRKRENGNYVSLTVTSTLNLPTNAFITADSAPTTNTLMIPKAGNTAMTRCWKR
jgi:hypothetical protein